MASFISNSYSSSMTKKPSPSNLGPSTFAPVGRSRFNYGEDHVYMDISGTDISKQALQRGGALVNDTYKVKLEMKQTLTASGNFKNHYKIIEVLEFHPAQLPSQVDWIEDD